MTFRSGSWTGVVAVVLIGGTAFAAWKIVAAPVVSDAKPSKPMPPAAVAKVVKEDELNTVTLTVEAEGRLGITVETTERNAIRRVRNYGGEITVPVGHAILVAAPLGGILKSPPGGIPRPGQPVKRGQPIFLLAPLLTPEARTTLAAARVDADGLVKNARTQVEAAKLTLDRAGRLFKEEVGSKRMVEEAQSQYDLAAKTLEAAEARSNLLAKAVGEIAQGTSAPIAIESPQDGLLRNIGALSDQNVPSGAALFEVVALDRVWVRVPLFVGDLPDIAESDDATVGSLTARPGEPTHVAKPVVAPPLANPLAATVDLYYEVDNRAGKYLPGQRVGVTVPMRGEAQSVTAPWSAVVHDIHGGAWVYQRTAPRTYVRRRVAVRYVVGDRAVLASGLPSGIPVVAHGAQELFGAETGFSK